MKAQLIKTQEHGYVLVLESLELSYNKNNFRSSELPYLLIDKISPGRSPMLNQTSIGLLFTNTSIMMRSKITFIFLFQAGANMIVSGTAIIGSSDPAKVIRILKNTVTNALAKN